MTSHSRPTSASEPAAESGSPIALVLSLWALCVLASLWHAEALRDSVLEAGGPRWTVSAADALVELADGAGLSRAHARSEQVRAVLYGMETELPPPRPQATFAQVAAMNAPTSVSTNAPSTEHAVAPSPRRVLLVGASSMQFAIGQAFELQLAAYQNLTVRRVAKVSTGLSRPEEFNWPARLEELLDEHTPDLVIVNFGGNDAQNIPLPKRQRAEFGSADWDALYAERVSDFVSRIRARGAQAVMIGMPIMRSEDFSKRMRRLNAVTEAATARAGGIYLDQWDLAATPAGAYRELVDEAGKSRPMRMTDGIHYSIWGGRYVVERLLQRLERHVTLVPKNETLAIMQRHTFRSSALAEAASYLAWLPRLAPGERAPWLVLLHGADSSPDDVADHLQAQLATLAQRHRLAIVVPDGGAAGWWLDSASKRYASFVAKDLAADVCAHLPVSAASGVTGISMGGHGALTLALQYPELFRSASSVSGVVDLTRAADRPALVELLGPLAEQRARWESHSALQLLERAPERARGLALRFSCGLGDRWLEANRALHASADARGIAHTYDEAPGDHAWSYWQSIVPQHVAWHANALSAPK